jgi:Lipocalin-like domain
MDGEVNSERLLGVWRLVSYVIEDLETKERMHLFGERPTGYLALLPAGRAFAIITAEGRSVPTTCGDRDVAFRSMLSYSGRYVVKGETFSTDVDVAWNEAWVGTKQNRTYRIEGNDLFIMAQPQPNPNFGNRMMQGILTWRRES